MKSTTYEELLRLSKVKTQKEFCSHHSVPYFLTEDGICPFCDKDIFRNITEQQAGLQMITSCSQCKRSFVE